MSATREQQMARMKVDMDHHNAIKQRETWCHCCGRAVPTEDRSWKFAAAGGILKGPFCSQTCYWRFVTDHWNETTKEERRQFYLYGGSETGDSEGSNDG